MLKASYKIVGGILICFSLTGYPISKSENKTSKKPECQNLYRILGASFVAGSVVAAGLSFLDSNSIHKTGDDKRKNKTEIPKAGNIKISELQTDKELFSRASDLADYLVDKYKEDPKFSGRLRQFMDQHPQESITALSVRHGLKEKNLVKAKELFAEIGSRAHYSLTFAWIVSAVYNEPEKVSQKTLRDIIVGIEQEIEGVDYYTD